LRKVGIKVLAGTFLNSKPKTLSVETAAENHIL